MKVLLTLSICLTLSFAILSQNVGIGTLTPDSSAVLDITSLDKGVLLPRMDSTSRKNIVNPKDGLILYDSTSFSFWFYRDTVWTEFHWEPGDNLGNHIAIQDLDMSNQRINNLNNPMSSNDAANKSYVDEMDAMLAVDILHNETDIVVNLSLIDNNTSNITNNSTAINTHTTNDTDLSPTNELQALSISGQDLAISSGNTITLPTISGIFENHSGVVRNTGTNTDDFIFGDSNLPVSNTTVNERMFFFDENKGAFRAGRLLNSDVWGTDKIGSQSMAFGINPEASGTNSIAIGDKPIASETNAIAIGNSATATEDNSVSIGSFNNATGNGAVSIGSNSNASGTNSVALGRAAKAIGNESLATGFDTQANGLNSIAMGYKSEGNGDYSAALGWQTRANGNFTTAFGIGTRAGSYGSTALGRYNVVTGDGTNWINTDPIFEIGIGTMSTNRANAITVLKNGTVSFKDYTFPNADGTANEVMQTDGSGNLSWTPISGGSSPFGTTKFEMLALTINNL